MEDQQAIRKFVVAALSEYGYRVIEASNGEEALARASDYSGQLDLLMTDVVMPGMNGRELAEQLQKAHPELKVLFISGYTAEVLARRGVLDRGISLLHKPFGPEELASKVRAVLRSGTRPSEPS